MQQIKNLVFKHSDLYLNIRRRSLKSRQYIAVNTAFGIVNILFSRDAVKATHRTGPRDHNSLLSRPGCFRHFMVITITTVRTTRPPTTAIRAASRGLILNRHNSSGKREKTQRNNSACHIRRLNMRSEFCVVLCGFYFCYVRKNDGFLVGRFGNSDASILTSL